MKSIQVVHTTEHPNAINIDNQFALLRPIFQTMTKAKLMELPLLHEFSNIELMRQSLYAYKATILTYIHNILVLFENITIDPNDVTINRDLFIARLLSGYFNIPHIYRATDMRGWQDLMPPATKVIPFFVTLCGFNALEQKIDTFLVKVLWTEDLLITLQVGSVIITV